MPSNISSGIVKYKKAIRTYKYYIDREDFKTELTKDDLIFLPDMVEFIHSFKDRNKHLDIFFKKKEVNSTGIEKHEKVFQIIKAWT